VIMKSEKIQDTVLLKTILDDVSLHKVKIRELFKFQQYQRRYEKEGLRFHGRSIFQFILDLVTL